MIYEGSQNNNVAINTKFGISSRKNIPNIITQGGPLGSIICSTQIDKIGKEQLERNVCLYKYKNNVEIPSLAMVDDVCTISECGIQSVERKRHVFLGYSYNCTHASSSTPFWRPCSLCPRTDSSEAW